MFDFCDIAASLNPKQRPLLTYGYNALQSSGSLAYREHRLRIITCFAVDSYSEDQSIVRLSASTLSPATHRGRMWLKHFMASSMNSEKPYTLIELKQPQPISMLSLRPRKLLCFVFLRFDNSATLTMMSARNAALSFLTVPYGFS